MRSPARDRNSLFDIAVAGPLAGLMVAMPALWLGLRWSHVAVVPPGGGMTFGDSLLMRLMTFLVFGAIPAGMDVFVHPVALAGWVGLFVTALNLFPVGQLDGGRIAYALFGARPPLGLDRDLRRAARPGRRRRVASTGSCSPASSSS